MAEFLYARVLTLWLKDLLHDFETHEADEWFRIKGKLVTNPHG